eukprot:1439156-Prymnesium_polylepis.1
MSDFAEGMGRARHLMTQYEYTLNLKGGAKIKKMSSFHRFLGITNPKQGEIAPVPVTEDERRLILIYSSRRLKGNTDFWNELYALVEGDHPWNAIRSILQYMLSFEHGPMFTDTEIPSTEFHKTATITDPIKMFLRDYANESEFEGVLTISSDTLWKEFVTWCSHNNESLGRMSKDTFSKQLTRFDIPGVSRPKDVKDKGRVVKK